LAIGVIIGCMNSIAIFYGSSAAIPIEIILKIIALYFLINLPLTLASGILAKNLKDDSENVQVMAKSILKQKEWY